MEILNFMIRARYLFRAVLITVLFLSLASCELSDASKKAAHKEQEIDWRQMWDRVKRFKLGNGLEVISIPLPESKSTVVMLWFGVGSAEDPKRKSGLAHFTEHATFSALGENSKKNIPEAFTSFDYTAYYHVTQSDQLDSVFQHESKRLSISQVGNTAVNDERGPVLQEREDVIESNALVQLEEEMRALLFGDSPYGMPIVGSGEDTNSVSASDVDEFLNKWYVPSNAILLVSGAIEAETLRPLVERYFGELPERKKPLRHRPKTLPPSKRSISIENTDAVNSLWARMYQAPSHATGDPREVVALQLLATILADHHSKKLHTLFVDNLGLAEEISVEYSSVSLGESTFTIFATLAPGIDVAYFQQAMNTALSKLLEDGISLEEVIHAREVEKERLIDISEDALEVGTMVGSSLMTGQPLENLIDSFSLMFEIESDELNTTMRRLLNTSNAVTGLLSRPIH